MPFGDAAHDYKGTIGIISLALVCAQFTAVLSLRDLADGVEVNSGRRAAGVQEKHVFTFV